MNTSGDWAYTQKGRILTKVKDRTRLSPLARVVFLLVLAALAVGLVFFLSGSVGSALFYSLRVHGTHA